MVRALLEDRFKLKTHVETREGQVYTLVLARADGKLGRDLKKTGRRLCGGACQGDRESTYQSPEA